MTPSIAPNPLATFYLHLQRAALTLGLQSVLEKVFRLSNCNSWTKHTVHAAQNMHLWDIILLAFQTTPPKKK